LSVATRRPEQARVLKSGRRLTSSRSVTTEAPGKLSEPGANTPAARLAPVTWIPESSRGPAEAPRLEPAKAYPAAACR
jgi:hypothetical protein